MQDRIGISFVDSAGGRAPTGYFCQAALVPSTWIATHQPLWTALLALVETAFTPRAHLVGNTYGPPSGDGGYSSVRDAIEWTVRLVDGSLYQYYSRSPKETTAGGAVFLDDTVVDMTNAEVAAYVALAEAYGCDKYNVAFDTILSGKRVQLKRGKTS